MWRGHSCPRLRLRPPTSLVVITPWPPATLSFRSATGEESSFCASRSDEVKSIISRVAVKFVSPARQRWLRFINGVSPVRDGT